MVQSENAALVRILLIANYPPDGQRSMLRYAALLEQLLPGYGCSVKRVAPRAIFRLFSPPHAPFAKCLGYIDKLVLFPAALRARVRRVRRVGGPLIVHVCDHSNSPYLCCLGKTPSLITVHDLLAVRRARGEFGGGAGGPLSRRYQRLIVRGLRRARHAICDSDATRNNFQQIIGRPPGVFQTVPVPLDPVYAEALSSGAGDTHRGPDPGRNAETPRYLLHVGAGAWYKNRAGLIDACALVARRMPDAPHLRIVGPEFEPALRARVQAAGLSGRIHVLSDVSDPQLRDLYAAAECLVFPSLEEGFGWPIIEAHACGCAVIASNRAPMTEVGGDAVLYVEPTDAHAIANAIVAVLRRVPAEKAAWRERGRRNAGRYLPERVLPQLIDIYREIAQRPTGR